MIVAANPRCLASAVMNPNSRRIIPPYGARLLNEDGNALNFADPSEVDLLDGLQVFFPLSEAALPFDELRNGQDITEDSGTTDNDPGHVYPTALVLDGSSYIYRSPGGVNLSGFSAMTVAVWLNKTADGGLVRCSDGSTLEYLLSLSAGAPYVIFRDLNASSPNALAAGWNLVIAYASASGIGIDVNGVEDIAAAGGSLTGLATNPDFSIGTDGEAMFTGLIGPVAIWNRVLSADERLALWNDGDGLTYDNL